MRQAWLTTCRVSDVQATDDRGHELLWRAISRHDKYAQPSRPASKAPTVDLPLPETPAITTIIA